MTTTTPSPNTQKTHHKTHIVIPARHKSSRLPGKPLLPIHGKPMILWVAQKASLATFADDLTIATDDKRIADVCRHAGYDVLMTDVNHASGTDRLAEVVTIKGWADDDIVINMQGDEPLVPPLLLEQTKNLLLKSHDAVMATLCEPIHSYEELMRPSVVKVVADQHNHALYFSRAGIPCDREHALAMVNNRQTSNAQTPEFQAQKAPTHAYRHLGLYAYRVAMLKEFGGWQMGMLEQLEALEQLRVLEQGKKIAVDIALASLPAGVDTQADLDRLNQLPLTAFGGV